MNCGALEPTILRLAPWRHRLTFQRQGQCLRTPCQPTLSSQEEACALVVHGAVASTITGTFTPSYVRRCTNSTRTLQRTCQSLRGRKRGSEGCVEAWEETPATLHFCRHSPSGVPVELSEERESLTTCTACVPSSHTNQGWIILIIFLFAIVYRD